MHHPGGHPNRRLPVTNQTEVKNCFNRACTPSSTFGARIPDGPLRASKENVAVTFSTSSGDETVFTLRRGLIDAYLRTVDSVMASFKR